MAHERGQHAELTTWQRRHLSAHPQRQGRGIEAEFACSERRLRRLGGTAKQGPDAREQLVEREGFHQIVVGALVERGYALDYVGPRSDDEDAGLASRAPKRAQDVASVAVRQREV